MNVGLVMIPSRLYRGVCMHTCLSNVGRQQRTATRMHPLFPPLCRSFPRDVCFTSSTMCSLAVQRIIDRVAAGEVVDEIDISSGLLLHSHYIQLVLFCSFHHHRHHQQHQSELRPKTPAYTPQARVYACSTCSIGHVQTILSPSLVFHLPRFLPLHPLAVAMADECIHALANIIPTMDGLTRIYIRGLVSPDG